MWTSIPAFFGAYYALEHSRDVKCYIVCFAPSAILLGIFLVFVIFFRLGYNDGIFLYIQLIAAIS